MFCCTAQPSCTWPTSFRNTVGPFVYLIGMSLRSLIAVRLALVRTVYCVSPILARPDGSVRLWALTALTTSAGVKTSGLKLERVDVDHDLPVLAPVRRREGHARHRSKLLAQVVVTVIVQLLLVEAVGAQTELQHGDAGGIVRHPERQVGERRGRCARTERS